MSTERTLAASGLPLQMARVGASATAKIGNDKYPALTGVRALGAMVVFFDHFPLWPDAHLTLNVMAFFFALSGFLIVRIYYEQAELSREWLMKYFVNRFARIYPVYFLLLSIAVYLHHGSQPVVLVTNYTLTHALFQHMPFIIQPSWSLTVEECFYALAPLFMILARNHHFSAAFLFGCCLLAAALGVSTLGGGFLGSPAFVFSTTFFGNFVEFLAGVYIALAVIKLESKRTLSVPGNKFTTAGVAGVLLSAFLLIMIYRRASLDLPAIILVNNFLIPLPIALLYWGLIRERTLLSRILASRAFRVLGRGSYSFYLLHTLIIDYVSVPLLTSMNGYRPLYVAVTFVATWVIAILMFLFYEEPLNIFIRQKFRAASGHHRS